MSQPGLDEAARTLYAFQRDLESRGLADRVLTLVWSEFGRRPHENASAGSARARSSSEPRAATAVGSYLQVVQVA